MDTFGQDLRFALRTLRGSPRSHSWPWPRWPWASAPTSRSSAWCRRSCCARCPIPRPTASWSPRTSIPDFEGPGGPQPVLRRRGLLGVEPVRRALRRGRGAAAGRGGHQALLPLLGGAALGRTFRPEEDGQALAVISHSLWQRRYAGRQDVLGKTIELADRPYTIVGVMPPAFEYPDRRFEVWSTMGAAMSRNPEQLRNRALRIFGAVLLRKPDVPAASAALRRPPSPPLSRRSIPTRTPASPSGCSRWPTGCSVACGGRC